MATMGHVLTAIDAALQAFFRAAEIADLPDTSIVRGKECVNKELPVLICACDRADRKRAKNWEVTGSIKLVTDPTNDAGEVSETKLDASTVMETAVIDTLEGYVPSNDRPQPLAAAITAAMIASGLATADTFLMTAFSIQRVSAGFDDDSVWTLQVDFLAQVIVQTN